MLILFTNNQHYNIIQFRHAFFPPKGFPSCLLQFSSPIAVAASAPFSDLTLSFYSMFKAVGSLPYIQNS